MCGSVLIGLLGSGGSGGELRGQFVDGGGGAGQFGAQIDRLGLELGQVLDASFAVVQAALHVAADRQVHGRQRLVLLRQQQHAQLFERHERRGLRLLAARRPIALIAARRFHFNCVATRARNANNSYKDNFTK